MAKTNKNQIIKLLNTRAWLDYAYEDYCEYCEDFDIEPAEEDSDAYFNWKIDQCSIETESSWEELKLATENEYGLYIITGSCGLWNGRHDIVPEHECTLFEALEKCVDGSCDDYEIDLDTKSGVINVYGYHYDGTNCFEIHKIREYCRDAYNKAVGEYMYGDAKEIEIKDGWFQKIKNPFAA